MEGGDLRQLVVESPLEVRQGLGNKTLVQMLLDVTSALAYLHDRELMHRDLKTQNIVLDGSLRAVLCDFGFARKASKSNQMAMTICGTDEFMAPEVIFGMEYGLAADMFSMGVVACEMVCQQIIGDQGFLVRTPQGSFGIDMNEVKAALCGNPPSSLMLWIEQCLTNEAEDRLNAVDAEGWLRELIDELPQDCAELVLSQDGPGWRIQAVPTSDAEGETKSNTAVAASMNQEKEEEDEDEEEEDVVPDVPPRSAAAQSNVSVSISNQDASLETVLKELPPPALPGPPIAEAATAATTSTTSTSSVSAAPASSLEQKISPSSVPSTKKKANKSQRTSPCGAPGCEALQRHASGFCPLHAYLRKFKHVMYASKRGYKRKTWRRRFFCLDDRDLKYFKTMDTVRKNGTPQGIIQLSDTILLGGEDFIDTVADPKVTKDRLYCARLHTTARTFYFQFDTQKERTAFIDAIKPLRKNV